MKLGGYVYTSFANLGQFFLQFSKDLKKPKSKNLCGCHFKDLLL